MKGSKGVLWLVAVTLAVTEATEAGIRLTPTSVSRLYVHADSIQSDGTGGYLGNGVSGEAEWRHSTGSPGAPTVFADDDPIGPPIDGWTTAGLSSFAVARSEMTDAGGWTTLNNRDTFELFVNNQATQDPGGAFGPEGWGYKVAYALITYETAPTGSDAFGDAMTVTLDLGFSGTVYADDVDDEYLLDVGYALGTGLTDYDPVVVDPANNPNPGLGQFDVFRSWRSKGPSSQQPAFSDSLQYAGVIGDQVQVLMAVSSFSYSYWGYTWTDGTLDATITAVPAPGAAVLAMIGMGMATRLRRRFGRA